MSNETKSYIHFRGTHLSKGKPKMNVEERKIARRTASRKYRERHMSNKTCEKYKKQLEYNRQYQKRMKESI